MHDPTVKPHVTHLITSSAPGGAQRYVAALAKAAMERFEVTVMAGEGGEALFRGLPGQVRTARAPHLRRRIAPASDLRAVFEVRRFIDEADVDILHCNSTKAGLVGALAAALSKRRPKVIYTAHGWAFLEARGGLFRGLMLAVERLAARWRDATIVLSESERHAALHHGLAEPETALLIPHGVDREELGLLSPGAARDRLAGGDAEPLAPFVYGTIANAYPAKALPVLISAFEKIAAERPNAELVIVGGGPGYDALKARRGSSFAAHRIRLTGPVEDAARLLSGFNVFVLSSTKEGLPWAVLEAAAAGIPVVATKVGALPELIDDGRTGLLVPPGDAEALSEAMRRVHDDPELRARLAWGVREIADIQSRTGMIEETLGVYASLLMGAP